MSEQFVAYPSEFPISAVAYFAPVLRGSAPDDLNTAINAGQAIQLWACGQTFPVGDVGVQSEKTAGDVADWLDAQASGAPMAAGWEDMVGIMLPILLDKIGELLKRRRERR